MARKRKLLKRAAGFIGVMMVIGTVLNWRNIHMVATYNPVFLPTKYETPATDGEARVQDARHMRKFLKLDRSFSDKVRADFTAIVDDLDKRAAELSPAEFYLAVSRAVALADNGHTNISTSPLNREFNQIPVKFYWFKDGLHIVRASGAHADCVGRRVTAIDGVRIDDVVAALTPYRGGTASWRKLTMLMMMESPEILHAAGLGASPDQLRLTLDSPCGIERDLVLKGANPDGQTDFPFRRSFMSLGPDPMPGEGEDWVRTLSGASDVPLYLQMIEQPTFAPLAHNGRYIRTISGFGAKEQSIPEFFTAALDGIDDGSLDYLAVDFRINQGGDYLKSINFAKTAPAKLKKDGKLYILVGPETFSAAVVTVAMLKYYGGDNSLIVGTPMGDREQFWAETGMGFKLPNSKWYVNYATGYHDWEKGCNSGPSPHTYCFTFNRKHEVPAGPLTPDVHIETAYADYSAGRDPVLDWVRTQEAN